MPAEAVIDVALSNFSVMAFYLNRNLVTNRIAPPIVVDKNPGEFQRFLPIEAVNIQHETQVAHGGQSTELSFRIEKDYFATELHGKMHFVSDRELAMASQATVDYRTGVEHILMELALGREAKAAELLLTEGNYFSDAADPHWFASATPWDGVDANPKDDIDRAVRAVKLHSGRTPNTLLLPPTSYDVLMSNMDIKDLIRYMAGLQYLQTGRIPGDLIYKLNIIEAGAVYDANAPLETADLGFLWEEISATAGDDWAWIGYVDPNPGLKSSAFLSQFAFNNGRISDQDIITLYTIREEKLHGTWYDAQTDYQVKITNDRAAALVTGVKGIVS